jgi:hypothetical protein
MQEPEFNLLTNIHCDGQKNELEIWSLQILSL